MTPPQDVAPEGRQVARSPGGGLHLSVWMFRASMALLALGLVARAANVTWAGPEAALTAALLRVGLIALMATPALRVADLLAAYIRRADWATVAAMLAVLAVIAATLWVAFR